jgi:hypothetical protein
LQGFARQPAAFDRFDTDREEALATLERLKRR